MPLFYDAYCVLMMNEHYAALAVAFFAVLLALAFSIYVGTL